MGLELSILSHAESEGKNRHVFPEKIERQGPMFPVFICGAFTVTGRFDRLQVCCMTWGSTQCSFLVVWSYFDESFAVLFPSGIELPVKMRWA